MVTHLDGPYFTCGHLTDDFRCDIYDERPRMCRDYPYGKTCGFCGYQEPTLARQSGVTFPCDVGVRSLGGGWYRMPDHSTVRGPVGVVAWMRENRATLTVGSQPFARPEE